MFARGFKSRKPEEEANASKGFDDFKISLGDLMRGERATMGKSLLDVQRELKIKATYISAIEDADPSVFDTPGFIAGFVRSYARYLNMDPEECYNRFCQESGFATAHGMSPDASRRDLEKQARSERLPTKDIFAQPMTPYLPERESFFSRIEPGAIGSVLVLLLLIGGLGYSAWSILQEVQRVEFAPVEQSPIASVTVDPLARASTDLESAGTDLSIREIASFDAPSSAALDLLYRPQALDAPVMENRDGPIASLDPNSVGTLVEPQSALDGLRAAIDVALGSAVQVTETPPNAMQIISVRPAWVRLRSADGAVIFQGVMEPGTTYDVAASDAPSVLRVGESGAIYFRVGDEVYGPAGRPGTVSNVTLASADLVTAYPVADLAADPDLSDVINYAEVVTE